MMTPRKDSWKRPTHADPSRIFVAGHNTSSSLDALSGLAEWRLRRGG
jgi:hypothetical protein